MSRTTGREAWRHTGETGAGLDLLSSTDMWLELALVAAFLTSFLPIVNKRLLADTPVSVVAWGVNALSLPILGFAAVVLLPLPAVDAVFWLGIVGVALILVGGYVLNLRQLDAGWWRPFAAMLTQPAMLLAITASFIWGLTPIAEKLAI
ncbi:MAG: hypothetical protein ACRDIY_17650 [Chloroflexota bacterium]